MKSFIYDIKDEIGIHARPAGLLVKEASKYSSKIIIKNLTNKKEAEAKKLFGVMGLSVKNNDKVEVIADGEDEEKAISEIKDFFEKNL